MCAICILLQATQKGSSKVKKIVVKKSSAEGTARYSDADQNNMYEKTESNLREAWIDKLNASEDQITKKYTIKCRARKHCGIKSSITRLFRGVKRLVFTEDFIQANAFSSP